MGTGRKQRVLYPKEKGKLGIAKEKSFLYPKEKGKLGTAKEKSFLYPKEKGKLGTAREKKFSVPKRKKKIGYSEEKKFSAPKRKREIGYSEEKKFSIPKRKTGKEERIQNMVLFKSRYEKELDALMTKIDMNMSNNYKDNAQADFQELESRFTEMKERGHLKEKSRLYYENRVSDYREKLKGYTHKDQKPYWT